MKRYSVRIMECTSREDRVDLTTRINLATHEDVIEKAVKKLFGKSCFWQQDSGLGRYYGQVFRPVDRKYGGGNTSVTCRARIDIEEGW